MHQIMEKQLAGLYVNELKIALWEDENDTAGRTYLFGSLFPMSWLLKPQ